MRNKMLSEAKHQWSPLAEVPLRERREGSPDSTLPSELKR